MLNSIIGLRCALPAALMTLVVFGCSDDGTKSSAPALAVTPLAVVRIVPYDEPYPEGEWLRVENEGDGVIAFDAFAGQGQWCYLYYGGIVDQVNSVAPDSFIVAFGTGSLEAGEYFDTIWVGSSNAVNSPVAIPIALTITNVIQTDPDSIVFRAVAGGENPSVRNLLVTGASAMPDEPLTFTLFNNQPWLEYVPQQGTAPTTVQVSVDISGLAPGMYYDTLVIEAPTAGEPRRIPVRLEVASWLKTALSESFDFFGIGFENPQSGVAVGVLLGEDGVISTTGDGGNHWDTLVSETDNFFDGLGDVWIVNGRTWAVGKSAYIYYSPDLGTSWSRQTAPDTMSARLNSVYFIDTVNGWAVGNDGVVIHTSDGGGTWLRQNSGTTYSLSSVWFTDQLRGWAVGNYGVILTTGNGGASWQQRAVGLVQQDLWDVAFVGTTGWAVGDDGVVLGSTDGGQTWTLLGRPTNASLRAVAFVDVLTGWAVGTGGTILRTDDGGVSWRQQASGVTTILHDVFFLDENLGWICGFQGTLLRTTGGGE